MSPKTSYFKTIRSVSSEHVESIQDDVLATLEYANLFCFANKSVRRYLRQYQVADLDSVISIKYTNAGQHGSAGRIAKTLQILFFYHLISKEGFIPVRSLLLANRAIIISRLKNPAKRVKIMKFPSTHCHVSLKNVPPNANGVSN